MKHKKPYYYVPEIPFRCAQLVPWHHICTLRVRVGVRVKVMVRVRVRVRLFGDARN